MSKITAFLFILSIAAQNLYSIDTTAAKYYPLVIGNIYVYRENDSGPPPTIEYHRTTIVKDSVFNNHRYFLFRDFPSGNKAWKRVDSLTNNIMRYDSANSCPYYNYENFVDSLSAGIGDLQRGACNSSLYSCDDTNHVIIFGIQSQYKGFLKTAPYITLKHLYSKYIGYYQQWVYLLWGSNYQEILTGCVLNGVVYGDTAMPVGIKQINTEVPGDFVLYQNYPNPFNPSTIIKYSIKKEAHVIIKIYSLSGEEISVRVNQLHQPGTYSLDFNASGYSSGVYFYRMEVYDLKGKALYSESRKMLLIK